MGVPCWNRDWDHAMLGAFERETVKAVLVITGRLGSLGLDHLFPVLPA